MAEEVGLYQFMPDAKSCDICKSMEGTYEDAPQVPVHPHCDCQVIALAGGDANCEYEIVNLAMDQENYTETQSLWLEVSNPLAEDTDLSVTVQLGVEDASFDEGVLPAVEENFGWSPHTYQVIISQTLPAGTVGMVEAEVEFEMSNTIYEGERRRACYTENDDGSINADFADVGSVGGITIERTDVASFDIHATESGNEADFFTSPDESPY